MGERKYELRLDSENQGAILKSYQQKPKDIRNEKANWHDRTQ